MVIFKKIAAYFLLVIYFLSATAAGELLKLPILIAHYDSHRKANENVGITAFIIMHYSFEDRTGNGKVEHKRLPFKSAEHNAGFSFISVAPPLSATILPDRGSKKIRIFRMIGHKFLSLQYLAAIWQPPRLV